MNERAPMQLAHCRFPGLAISSAQILMYFSKILYGSTLIKQYSETVMVRNYQNANCSLRKKFYCVIYYNFRHTFALYLRLLFVWTSFMDDPWVNQWRKFTECVKSKVSAVQVYSGKWDAVDRQTELQVQVSCNGQCRSVLWSRTGARFLPAAP